MVILGGEMGQSDLMRNVCARYRYYYRMSFRLDAARLGECHTVVMARGGTVTGMNRENLSEFLRKGGNLILPGGLAKPFLALLPDVFGPEAKLTSASAPGFRAADHPLFGKEEEEDEEEMFDEAEDEEADEAETETDKQGWSTTLFGTVLTKASGGQALVRWGEHAAVWVKDVGKGKVVFLADGVFPLSEIKSKVCVVPVYEEFLDRLFAFIGVPRLDEAVAKYGKSVVWQRDPGLEGGRALQPPFPTSEDEIVERLAVCLGRNEHERIPFYTSVSFEPERAKVTISALQGAGGTIPPAHVKIGTQGRPSGNYRGPLVYIRWLDNGETLGFASPVMTWWLSVWARDVSPGTYDGTVELALGKERFRLPLKVVVDEARIPERRPFRYDAEFYYYRPPEPGVMPALQELGIDFFIGGVVGYSTAGPVVRSTGKSLIDFARKSKVPLRDKIPPLDFSGWLGRGDLYTQELLRHNITRFRTYAFWGFTPKAFVSLTQGLYRDERLEETSPENERTIIAVMREISRFFREKGYLKYYTKHMDEWSGTAIDGYLRVAIPLAKAGWSNVGNPNPRTPLSNRVQRRRLWPYIHLYWMEDEPELWYDLQRLEPFLPGSEMRREYYTVITGSVWWYVGYLMGSRVAWGYAYRGYSGIHQHGWRRWTYETYNALYLKEKQQFCPSMGILMMAEGIEESQYVHVLKDMIAHLDGNPATRDKATELRAKLGRIVGESPDALLTVVKDWVRKPGLTRAHFTRARNLVFGLLAEARKALQSVEIKPTLRWGDFHLVRDGARSAVILHSGRPEVAAGMGRQILLETGVALPLGQLPADQREWAKLNGKVILIDSTDRELFGKVSAHLGGIVNERYPRDGAYVIHEDEAGNLWTVGKGSEVLALGTMNVLRVSDLSPCWYRPGLFGTNGGKE